MLNLNRSLERKVGIDSGGCGRCMIGSGNDAGSSGRGEIVIRPRESWLTDLSVGGLAIC